MPYKTLDARRRRSSADAGPAKIVPGRKALKNISGRRAGRDHPGRKARFAGKDLQCQSADAGQSPSVASQATPGQFRLRRANKDR